MQPHNTQQPRGMLDEMKSMFSLGECVLGSLMLPLAAFTTKHGTAGEKYFTGLPVVLAYLLMMLLATLGPSVALMGTAQLFLLAVALHRARHQKLRRQGYHPHSLFIGEPKFGRGAPFFSLVLGLLVIGADLALGIYLIGAGFGLAARTSVIRMREEAEVRAMNDSLQAQTYAARRFREQMGEIDE